MIIDFSSGCYMGKHFFDFEDSAFAHSISDNMAIDSDGELLMRMSEREENTNKFVFDERRNY